LGRAGLKIGMVKGFFRSPKSILGRTAHTKCGLYLLASSLAAALPAERRVLARRGRAGEKVGLFEHPARCSPVVQGVRTIEFPPCHNSFCSFLVASLGEDRGDVSRRSDRRFFFLSAPTIYSITGVIFLTSSNLWQGRASFSDHSPSYSHANCAVMANATLT
jgi:hypothetical protein